MDQHRIDLSLAMCERTEVTILAEFYVVWVVSAELDFVFIKAVELLH
jgi:hypothetical protein